MVDVIMKDNTDVEAKDIMPLLIESTVRDAIENSEGFDLRSEAGVEYFGEQIAEYLEIVTKETVDTDEVIKVLKWQLRRWRKS